VKGGKGLKPKGRGGGLGAEKKIGERRGFEEGRVFKFGGGILKLISGGFSTVGEIVMGKAGHGVGGGLGPNRQGGVKRKKGSQPAQCVTVPQWVKGCEKKKGGCQEFFKTGKRSTGRGVSP